MLKKIIFVIVIIAILILSSLMLLKRYATGGKRSDVLITKQSISEDEKEISVDTTLTTSMGYIKTYKTEQDGDKLYITFYSTFGLNNKIGAKSNFDINIEGINSVYYYCFDEYKLIWEKEM